MMTEVFIRILLPMSLAGGLFWLLLQPLRPLLAQLHAGWRKCLLLVCAALLLLPWPILMQPSAAQKQAPMAEALSTAAPTAPVYNAGRTLGQTARPAEETVEATTSEKLSGDGIFEILVQLYWIGATLSLAVATTRHARLMRRLNTACTPVEEEPLRQYRETCAELNLAKAPALCQSDAVFSPVLAGLVRSRIILPRQALKPHQLRYALLHELNHYKNRDLPFKYLMLLAGVLHWYNPAAQLLRREFTDVCEQSCDAAVARKLDADERRQYAAVLLDFAGPPAPALVSAFASPAKRLKTRLRRLMQPVKTSRALRACGALASCLLLAAAVLAGCSLAAGTSDSSASTSAPVSVLPDSSADLPASPSSSEPAAPDSSLPESAFVPEASASEPQYVSGSVTNDEDGSLLNPVPDSEYSTRGFSTGGHRGLDLNAPVGTPIVACADGTVLTSDWHYSYGYHVVIDHGGGLTTLYAHNSENYVAAGDSVTAGQQIAAVGETGNAAGPLCHLEVTLDDTLVDPRAYVDLPDGY